MRFLSAKAAVSEYMSPQVTDGPLVALRALEDVLQRSCADEFLKTAAGDDCLFDLLLRTLQNVHNDCLDELLGSVASDVEKKIGLLRSQLESDTIKDFIVKVDARLGEADLSVLFAAAVSEACKNAHSQRGLQERAHALQVHWHAPQSGGGHGPDVDVDRSPGED